LGGNNAGLVSGFSAGEPAACLRYSDHRIQ